LKKAKTRLIQTNEQEQSESDGD